MTRGCTLTTKTGGAYRIDVCGKCHTTARVPLTVGKLDTSTAVTLKGTNP